MPANPYRAVPDHDLPVEAKSRLACNATSSLEKASLDTPCLQCRATPCLVTPRQPTSRRAGPCLQNPAVSCHAVPGGAEPYLQFQAASRQVPTCHAENTAIPCRAYGESRSFSQLLTCFAQGLISLGNSSATHALIGFDCLSNALEF